MQLNEKRYGTDNWLKQPDKKKDFISWTSLGVDNPNDENWLSYEEAQKIVQKAGIKSCQEYYNWKERPSNIPSSPYKTYKNEWNGWGEYLGTAFLSYEKAKKIVQQAGIKSCREYFSWKERPDNIPARPDIIYKNEWKGMGEYLGTDFLSYKEAQKIVQKAGIKTQKEYHNWKERPSNIPARPDIVYKNEWNGWGEFLGTGNGTTNFLFNRKANEILQKYLPKNQSRIAV